MKRPVLAGALLAVALGLAGCAEIGLARSVAFAPDIAGLDGSQPWVRLPVDSWVTEGGIEPVAVAGCFTSACSPPAAVGLFRARGAAADRLARIAADPERLVAALLQAKPRPAAAARPRAKVSAAAERLREGDGWRGFLLHLTRQDGSAGAHGAVLTRMAGGSLAVLIVVAPSGEAALRTAREVVAQQE
jgi:hypothetical protein